MRNKLVCLSGHKNFASAHSLISQSDAKIRQPPRNFFNDALSARSVFDERLGTFGKLNSGSKFDGAFLKQYTERETRGETFDSVTYRSRAKSTQRFTASRDKSERSLSQKLKESYLLKFPKSVQGERIRQIFKESDQR